MVFLDFLKNLGLNLETFCPFDIKVVDSESSGSGDINNTCNILLHEEVDSITEIVTGDDEVQSYRLCVDRAINVQTAPSSLIPNDRFCLSCDFCQPDEDFETGSDGMRCSVKGFVISDAKQCASTCSSYYCSETSDDM